VCSIEIAGMKASLSTIVEQVESWRFQWSPISMKSIKQKITSMLKQLSTFWHCRIGRKSPSACTILKVRMNELDAFLASIWDMLVCLANSCEPASSEDDSKKLF
jgi:hypothetical protein